MTWDYRVIVHKTNSGNPVLDAKAPGWAGLHEVYYDKYGNIDSWIATPEIVAASVEDLIGTLRMQLAASLIAQAGGVDVLKAEAMPGSVSVQKLPSTTILETKH